MKNQSSKKTIWQSLISLTVMGTIIVFATGSYELEMLLLNVPVHTETQYMGNDVYIETTQIGPDLDSYFILKEYKLDKYGRKHGEMKRASGFLNSEFAGVEERVNMVNGLRHGLAVITLGDGTISYRCYDMGVRVDCTKAALISATENSAFQIINNKYPWYLYSLNAFGFDNEYIESFTDSIETIMNSFEFEEEDFGNYFNIAIDSLKLTPYDSIINLYPVINYMYGLELMKNNEFRLAVIDYVRFSENSTFNIVKTTYPGFLYLIHEATDPEQDFDEFSSDFESFCMLTDSLMTSYGQLDTEDPFFIDSVDSRIYRAINTVESMEKSSTTAIMALKSAVSTYNTHEINLAKRQINIVLNQMLLDTSPKDIAQSVLFSMYIEYLNGNLLIYSVLEAYQKNNNIATLPTVTTNLENGRSATSASISGNVAESGGADVTERGIVWGTINNPTIENNIEVSGSGTGLYTAVLSGLTEGFTYYARAYALNSAGIAYGNCISFTARNTVGTGDKRVNDFDFKIFPNPASNEVYLDFDIKKPENIFIELCDLTGRIVLQKQIPEVQTGKNRIKINISDFQNGVYIIKLNQDGVFLDSKKVKITR